MPRPADARPSELRKAHQEIVEAARHAASDESEDADETVSAAIKFLAPSAPRLAAISEDDRTRHRWMTQRGHLFRLADLSAGVRAYSKGRSSDYWVGGECLIVSDDFIQLPVAVHRQSASVQEWDAYPAIHAKTQAAVGDGTVTMTTDRGFHVRSVFEHNLPHGISTISEWRQPKAGIWPENLECAAFDRDGVPRCRHCGDTTNTDGAGLGLFNDQHGKPYLLVRCEGRHTKPCSRPQRVPCGLEPRLLQPINPHEAFWDLNEAHKNKEGLFQNYRDRYRVAGNDFAERPKRRQSPRASLRATSLGNSCHPM